MPHEMSADSCSSVLGYTLSQADFDMVPNSAFAAAKLDDDSGKRGVQPGNILKGITHNHSNGAVTNGSHPAHDSKIATYERATANGSGQNGCLGLNGSLVNGSLHFDAKLHTEKEWNIRRNPALSKCVNPIRKITDTLGTDTDNGKEFISLAQGDPVRFGPHMKVPEAACSALIKVIQEAKHNGYSLSSGVLQSRRVLADYLSKDGPYNLSPQDIVLTLGAAQALHITIDVLRYPGCNILLPRPGFSLYEAICSYFDVEPRFYDLLGDNDWEIDLQSVEALADDNTIAVLVCNPGNPSGSVFSYQHLAQIATLAGELKVSIIADEVYAKMAFGKNPFVSMATFSEIVPVLAIGSISKGWLATGWRLGWIAMWDPHKILKKAQIPEGMLSIMQIESGPSTPIQAALPEILKSTPNSEFEKTRERLRLGADLSYARACKIKGLSVPTRPEGSMFMMVKVDLALFDNISSDTEFMQALLREESVLVLPGIAFGIPDWFRIVFALSLPQVGMAWDRIEEFCSRHIRQH